jgi:repressor LexA
MYENGNREPDFETLETIADYFNVDMNFLLDRKPTISANANDDWAYPIIRAYRRANRSTQEATCAVLRIAHVVPEGMEEEQLSIPSYTFPSAAGLPVWVEGDFEHRDFPASRVPAGTNFAIRIAGDSMEPSIADGSYVFVHAQPELQNGQIGIFMLHEDEAVCKRYYRGKGAIQLVSDNPKYDPILIGQEQDGFRIVGRVLSSVLPT